MRKYANCDKYRARFTIVIRSQSHTLLIAPSSAFARNFGTPSFVPMPATHNNRTCRPPPALGVRRVMRAEHLMTVGGEPNPANRQVLPTMRVSQFTRLQVARRSNTSPTKTYDSYTWPDSVAPSTNVTPVPLSYHAGWLPRIEKAVPVSDHVLRSHVGNKLVAKHKFRGLAVTPLNGLDFD